MATGTIGSVINVDPEIKLLYIVRSQQKQLLLLCQTPRSVPCPASWVDDACTESTCPNCNITRALDLRLTICIHFIHQWLYSPSVGPWPLLRFRNLFYTDGRTPWTSDQPVARPLPTHR
jgi:hypothetical protein